MAFDVNIPPSIGTAVSAMSKLPEAPGGVGVDASSIFSNTISADLTAALGSIVANSGSSGIICDQYANPGCESLIAEAKSTNTVTDDAAFEQFETIFNPIENATLYSQNMSEHVGQLQTNLPTVLKKSATANAVRGAVKAAQPLDDAEPVAAPDCTDDKVILSNVFPTNTPISAPGDATSESVGTLSVAGDQLQEDVETKTTTLVDAIDARTGGSPPQQFTDALISALNTAISNPAINYTSRLNDIYSEYGVADFVAPANDLAGAGNTMNTTVLKERTNVGLPNLDGTSLTDPDTGVTIPAGDKATLQVGAGNITVDIKKKAAGLQAFSMASNKCSKDIIARANPPGGDADSAAAMTANAIPKITNTAAEDATDPPIQDDTLQQIEEQEAVDEDDNQKETAVAQTKIDTFAWASTIYKVMPLLFSTEEGIRYQLKIDIPTQTFPTLSGTYVANWSMPDNYVQTSFFGQPKMGASLAGLIHEQAMDGLLIDFHKQLVDLKNMGLTVYSYNKNLGNIHSRVIIFIGDPELIFSVDIGVFDISGNDITNSGNGQGQLTYSNKSTGVTTTAGPVVGEDANFKFILATVPAKLQFDAWAEKGVPEGIKEKIDEYFATLP